jgi:predicted helicase
LHPYSILPPGALSPDIDLMESVLGIVHQAHGISYLYAHSVRVEHMSLSALGNRNYQLYNEVLDVIRRETPDHLVKSSDRFYVPIYRILHGQLHR